MNHELLSVQELKTYYRVSGKKIVKAVDDVTLSVKKGEIVGIVGESGCGKSTLGKSILRLTEPTSGKVTFLGREMTGLDAKELRNMRRHIQMIFQDPYASLNPRMKIKDILEEPLIVHKLGTKAERREVVRSMLEIVGLEASYGDRYAHQFSGGQRQRIGIAKALITKPKLIIADEPVSALDVSVQAQILNLLSDLQEAFNLTFLFISHDLAVVRYISDRVAVMYFGKIVEMADADALFREPKHPYTETLLAAVPVIGKEEAVHTAPDIAAPRMSEKGCPFYSRCMKRAAVCLKVEPPLEKTADGHYAACHFTNKEAVR
ncbi:ABC transporter ATP-binding protein [Bacillus haynesii]|uniref:ABC transporter ATP-binding protein n=1 Tax=Bacillus haynesii TaxID=1925021 RepID=UPI002280B933|nr:oligopeptide/dipeptide ABC transporter ATP-binding protein [Bacillus haynesii]MCY7912867.1 ATP-binding cassette domain-containing protein [Bacillus haynesii]MCY7927981.1 ATP-binding cassette domain-containing protein [Bacillus haynesii]MCY8774656.1 ATP-binding cassette domain-containing protein [Bacillus haynesii]MCY9400496.1 ATP-binding cassette domain-containing protein [Bacillus haynesii]MEC0787913.1 ATP-binding cassette domain-containing protein [Bacillus haynesii]